MFSPPMPGDVMVNFYINLSKLCLTVYQLHVLPTNTTKVSHPPVRPFIKSQWAARVTRRCAFCRWSLELQACRELRLAQPRSHVVSKAFVSFPFACRTQGSWGEDRGPPAYLNLSSAASWTTTASRWATCTRWSAWCPGSTTPWCSSPSPCSSASSSKTR